MRAEKSDFDLYLFPIGIRFNQLVVFCSFHERYSRSILITIELIIQIYIDQLFYLDIHHESRTTIDVIREMTCSSPHLQRCANLTVLDVYDEAALIGKDFERIIEGKSTSYYQFVEFFLSGK